MYEFVRNVDFIIKVCKKTKTILINLIAVVKSLTQNIFYHQFYRIYKRTLNSPVNTVYVRNKHWRRYNTPGSKMGHV